MSKKKNKRQIVQPKNKWFPKLRPFLFPILFGTGAVGAYFINTSDLMNKVQTGSNVGIQITWVVEVCTYLCVVGLIILGYQFESKLEKRDENKAKV